MLDVVATLALTRTAPDPGQVSGVGTWVVGSEPFVCYEFDSKAAETYAAT